MLYVANVANTVPDVLLTSTKSLSNAVVVDVSFDVTFSQYVRLGDVPLGIEIVWYAVWVVLLVPPRSRKPDPLCAGPVERCAPDNTHGALDPSNPPFTINSVPAAGLTVKVTGTLRGVFVAPVALTVIVLLYVPTARPVISTEAINVEGAVPLSGLTVSHEASLLADQFKVPTPVLVMLIV